MNGAGGAVSVVGGAYAVAPLYPPVRWALGAERWVARTAPEEHVGSEVAVRYSCNYSVRSMTMNTAVVCTKFVRCVLFRVRVSAAIINDVVRVPLSSPFSFFLL